MRRQTVITALVAILIVLGTSVANYVRLQTDDSGRTLRVGFVYEGDEGTPYTYSFMRGQYAIKEQYGDQVEIHVRSNVPEENGEQALQSLVGDGCELVFVTSYGYGEAAKEMAQRYPNVQFCAATCDNANTSPVLDNYHTFMGEIYEGRYVSGIVAGLKLAEMIREGTIREDQATVGYVAAFPMTEVISGYTAFLLGVRSVVPTATMIVRYTNTWNSYALEKTCAEKLIEDGCVLISQHSDTVGPAVACESADREYPIYSVGYNQSMLDVAPTTALVSARINWTPYMLSAVKAVQLHDRIETKVKGSVHGNDIGAGFDRDWVQIIEVNEYAVAPGTDELVEETIEQLEHHNITVFKGDYVGVDPNDPSDTINLAGGYTENENSSAPTFHYILQDVIEVR